MEKKDYLYTTQDGHELGITKYSKGVFGKQPCLVYVHGFKAFKNWGFVPYMAEFFAQKGIDVITFNFSHNGVKGHEAVFGAPELFAQNTFSREIKETREIINLCRNTQFFGTFLSKPLGLLGHSRGGGIAVLAVSAIPDVQAVCTWNAISTLDRYEKDTKEKWKRQGHLEVVNSRTKEVFQMNVGLLEDLEKNMRKGLNILDHVRELNRPLLILHSQNDETVPMYEAEQLNIFGDPALTTLRLIPDTGHTFGAVHPFDASTEALDLTLSYSLEFFAHHLRLG
ncbi:MAG: alpha/beta hydrolase [Bacteroidota bacterium]